MRASPLRLVRWTRLVATISFLSVASGFASAQTDAPPMQRNFIRGDTTQDGNITLADTIESLSFLFQGHTPPDCVDAHDTNDDDQLNLNDIIFGLQVQFGGIGGFPAPYPNCGPDPTADSVLSCNEEANCGGIDTRGDVAHFMRRAGYGPRPDLVDQVLAMGLDAYITSQLNPELTPDGPNMELQTRLAALSPTTDINHAGRSHILYGIYSQNQLREVLTEFWEQHYNTNFSTVRNYYRGVRVMGVPVYNFGQADDLACEQEWAENELIRSLAVMPFLDLLEASATNPTMLIYLDSVSNIAGDANENYARELLELHTMGVDNGYEQIDIEEVARCLTGWTVRKHAPGFENDPHAPALPDDDPTGIWSFHFDPATHDYTSKTIFSGESYQLVIPARTPGSTDGILDGFEVLDHLVGLNQTANYVCSKLVQKLIADTPPVDVVNDAVAEWFLTDGDIRAVVQVIIESPEFWQRANRWNKFETPFEYVISSSRSVDNQTLANTLLFNGLAGLSALEYRPFLFQTPDGQPEVGAEWFGTEEILGRIDFGFELANGDGDMDVDLVALMQSAGVTLGDSEAVTDFWLDLLFVAGPEATFREIAIEFLESDEDGIPTPLDPAQVSAYEARIVAFVGFLIGSPLGQKQ